VTVGENFFIPVLTAYDNLNDDLLVQVSSNLNTQFIGTYSIIYTAENEIGTTTLDITVHVIEHHDEEPIITLIDEVPTTYFTKELFIVPNANAVDYLGNTLTVYKSKESFTIYTPGV